MRIKGLLFVFVIIVLLIWGGVSSLTGAPQANAPGQPTPIIMGNALAGPPPFRSFWQMGGGEEVLGLYIAGPFIYNGSVIVIYENAVLALPLDYPDAGAKFYPINAERVQQAAERVNDPALSYRNGHNVPNLFVEYIQRYLGGWNVVGEPVDERYEEGPNFCQDFENLTLCFNKQSGSVFVEARGKEFYEEHASELLPLRKLDAASSSWHIQMTTILSDDNVLQLRATVFYTGSDQVIPSDARAIIEVFEAETGEVQWLKVRPMVGASGQIDDQVPLGPVDVSNGSVRYVARVCVWEHNTLQACEESSVQRWIP